MTGPGRPIHKGRDARLAGTGEDPDQAIHDGRSHRRGPGRRTTMPAAFDIDSYLPPSVEEAPSPRPPRVLVVLGRGHRVHGGRALQTALIAHPLLRASCDWDRLPASEPARAEDLLPWYTGGLGVLAARYPRNVPWTALPHVGPPHWRVPPAREDNARNVLLRQWGAVPRHELLSGVDRAVVVPGSDPVRAVAALAPVEEFLGRELESFLLEEDDVSRMVPLDRERKAAAEAEIRADTRFLWNWHWNAGMLFPALLDEAYRTRRPPGGNQSGQERWEDAALRALQRHPFALQVLYRVAQANPRPLPYDKAGPDQGILTGTGYTRDSGSDTAVLDWTGHGVGPAEFDPGRPHTDFLRGLEFCQVQLARSGLLVADRERRARLSPAGAELLRLLPPGCRDLGMPTRWITPAGRLGTPDDVPAMDRWATTVLRHVKKAANGLREAAEAA